MRSAPAGRPPGQPAPGRRAFLGQRQLAAAEAERPQSERPGSARTGSQWSALCRVRRRGRRRPGTSRGPRSASAPRSDLTTYRRFEALLGRNPDEGDEGIIRQLTNDRSILGEQAANEVAANAPLTRGDAVTAGSLLSVARQTGFDISERNGVASPMTDNTMTLMESDYPGPLVPWQVGQNAAKSMRRSERLGDRPIIDRLLCEMCGLPNGVIARSSPVKPPMAYTVSTKKGRRIVFRARVPTGRRFDAARLLGDKLLVRNAESLQPATRTHTFRQKMQRAFAAELLCPFDALLDRLDGDHSDDSIEEAAKKFRVSPMLVATRLENSGMLDSRHTRFAPS